MRTHPITVLLVVADGSLGGTSRSAVQFARAWRSAGYDVVVLALEPVAAGRDAVLRDSVRSATSLDAVPWEDIGLVHLHHWNWAADERARVRALLDVVATLPTPPRLLTNNIFSSPDPLLRAWPAPAGVGVLGTWSAHQYDIAMAGRAHPAPFVVANPQDLSFFRPPTPAERAAARDELGLGARPVVLRAGSALANKWSPAYGPLVQAARTDGVDIVLVNAPQTVRAAVHGVAGARLVERIRDDELMRRWYWAADAFALDAARGESFGNVVMEALGAGLPVVYRGRPLRDNTPWEFRDLPGFVYTEGQDAWVRACLRTAHEGRCLVTDRTRHMVEERYGVAAVGLSLARAAAALVAAPDEARLVSAPAGGRRAELGLRQRALVAVRHNPLAAVTKQTVNRLRTGSADAGVALTRR